jgi:hypothetical protein
MNDLLDVASVEVIARSATKTRKPEFVPEIGAVIRDVIYVKTRVHVVEGVVHVGKKVTTITLMTRCWRQNTTGWKSCCEFVEKVQVSAGLCSGTNTSHKSIIEPNNVVEIIDGGHKRSYRISQQ